MKKIISFIFLIALNMISIHASAATIIVDTFNDEFDVSTGNGYCSLREAVEAANTGTTVDTCVGSSGADTILLSTSGTYVITRTGYGRTNEFGHFYIQSDITIQGSSSSAITIQGVSSFEIMYVEFPGNLTLNDLTLTAGLTGAYNSTGILEVNNSIITANHWRGLDLTYAGTLTTVNDSLIENSLTGEGIRAGSSTLTVNRSIITNNASHGITSLGSAIITVDNSVVSFNGGNGFDALNSSIQLQNNTVVENNNGSGLYLIRGNLNINQSEIINNTNDGITQNDVIANITNASLIESNGGSGIFQEYSQLVIDGNSQILNNLGNRGHGGGIYNRYQSSVQLENVTIRQNQTTGNGGGIYSDDSSNLGIEKTVIAFNAAQNGAGLYNLGSANIMETIFRRNQASQHGGGIYHDSGSNYLDVMSSAIYLNQAQQKGGGVYNRGPLRLDNSTINQNTGSIGGGLYNQTKTTVWVSLNSDTVTNNGDGIFVETGSVNIQNTIIAGHTTNCSYGSRGNIVSLGFNLESRNTCSLTYSSDQTNTNPQLSPIANNGGFTPTQALQMGSPAIDAGVNSAFVYDQRGSGYNRIINGTQDVGAYEEQKPVLNPGLDD